MNNTITLSQLITRLATSTGVDNNSARRFLRAFFATVEDAIADGQTVTIKGIGTFRAVANELSDGKMTVSYTPDQAIAEELNRPFEMFDAVVLADDVNFSDQDKQDDNGTIELTENLETVDVSDRLETVDVSDRIETIDVGDSLETIEETATTTEPEETAVEEYQEEPQESLADRVKTILWPEEEEEKDEEEEEIPSTYIPPVKEKIERPVSKTEPTRTIKDNHADTEDYEDSSEGETDHKKLWIWCGVGIFAVAVIAYLAAVFTTPVDPVSSLIEPTEEVSTEPTETVTEEVKEVSVEDIKTPTVETPAPAKEEPKTTAAPTPAKKEPVYDTVEISLIRLAKKHYGEGSYWVFIYEANRDIISNPNRIRPGQKVVIPDRSTFPGNNIAETKSIAKRKQSEILDKFK